MLKQEKFYKLLEPHSIGGVKTRNRIIKSGAGMRFPREGEGIINEREISFYETLAKGGVGLIIAGHADIDYPLGLRHHYSIYISEDTFHGFEKLAHVIHKHNCPVFYQIQHSGPSYHDEEFNLGLKPLSASSIPKEEIPEPGMDVAKELSIPEIEELIDKFVNAAVLVKRAGFDGVEINASTNHLVNSFLSRVWNRRTDIYGCLNLNSRCKFACDIVKGIKKRLGKEYPVSILINGTELGVKKGTTPEESQIFAKLLQNAGVDAIQVRAYGYDDYWDIPRPEGVFFPEPPKPLSNKIDGSKHGAGALVPLAEGIKKSVSIPVITVGRLDPILGEKILRDGKADFIAMTRRLFADPELPNKLSSGRLEDIVPCTACTHCYGLTPKSLPVECRANPALGFENQYIIKIPDKKKKIIIVGGGPSGMAAARIAALKGYEVSIYDKQFKLGGLTSIASFIKGSEIEDIPSLIRYYSLQLEKLGVKLRLGIEVNSSSFENVNADSVIIATGGKVSIPNIKGIDSKIVFKSEHLYKRLRNYLKIFNPSFLNMLTKMWIPIGKKVIVIGGKIQGCELAEFLIKRGREVTIVETTNNLGEGLSNIRRKQLLKWLYKKGANILTEVQCDEITNEGLFVSNNKGLKHFISTNTIIPALPLLPNTDLFDQLKNRFSEIYSIGDCRQPGLIADAIADGFKTMFKI